MEEVTIEIWHTEEWPIVVDSLSSNRDHWLHERAIETNAHHEGHAFVGTVHWVWNLIDSQITRTAQCL
jgi:hypothetical protein